ncbi:glycoside hydrolase family 6 protein [Streptomyces sp. BRA346]|uniref:glycoside hydrolase family 6 protein n=1 Tax=Streptomyces sp. BRA346 TaxID=2878199 RepID=UPI00406460F3
MRTRRKTLAVSMAVLAATALPLLSGSAVQAAVQERVAAPSQGSPLYVPPADRASYRQVTRLSWRGDYRGASGLLAMVRTPQAVWYGDESPARVARLVRMTMSDAARRDKLPVLALYNVPGRDCGSYSAGGARTTDEYKAWIDAVARGIGDHEVMIVLEPDSLALLPSDCDEQTGEGTPTGADAAAGASAGTTTTGPTTAPALTGPTTAPALTEPTTAPALTEPTTAPALTGPTTAPALTGPTTLPSPEPQPGTVPTPGASAAAELPSSDPAVPTPSPSPFLPDDPADLDREPEFGEPAAVEAEPEPEVATETQTGADALTEARFTEIKYAVDTLMSLANAKVYLDAGHAGWHAVSSIVPRLVEAGIDEATGFALNVSHYQTDQASELYGRLISACLAYVADGGDPEACPEQSWSRRHLRAWLRAHEPDDPSEMKHFVTDTSRNGRGPWTPRYSRHTDPQSWCNPPHRGLGARPTTATGDPLHDAALWVKTPGQSDGRCLRGTSGPSDPVRGTVNPEAGQWFPDQALELVRFARPSVTP